MKFGSARNTVSSLPMFRGECASENDTIDRESTSGTFQFMAGSLDSPVSIAGMRSAASPKHSSIESKPDFEPYMPYHGVHTWAGITTQRSSASHAICAMSLADNFSIGRPSDARVLDLGESPVNVVDRGKIGHPDQKVHPAALAIVTPDARNLGGQNEFGAVSRENTFVAFGEFGAHLRQPRRMREVRGRKQVDALRAATVGQREEIERPAGR